MDIQALLTHQKYAMLERERKSKKEGKEKMMMKP